MMLCVLTDCFFDYNHYTQVAGSSRILALFLVSCLVKCAQKFLFFSRSRIF